MSFDFLEPETIEEAASLLERYGEDARLIAGGAALVLMIQQKLLAPQVLVSLEKVAGLSYLREAGGELHLGAMNRLSDVARSPRMRALHPALAEACGLVGNVRVRNQATLGGNLAEADYASDPPAVLYTLEAEVTAVSARGQRQISMQDFFRSFYTTALQPDEILSDIYIPALPPSARQVYLKYRSRSAEDRPCVGVAALADFQDGVCTDLRVAVGAACEIPYRNPELERLAIGRELEDALLAEIAEGYAAGLKPLEDLRGSAWYRRRMARVFVQRALEEVRNGDR